MKKSLLALATIGAFAGAAHAQSSVTVYGIFDQSIGMFNNGSTSSATNEPSTTVNASGLLATQRLGFRGTEDLGGGDRANFVIEGGLTNGGALSFARATYVEYAGKAWGSLSLGWRDLGTTNIDDAMSQAGNLGAMMTSVRGASVTNVTGNADGLGNDNANAVVYTSPTIAGFSAEIGYKAPHLIATGAASNTIGTTVESQFGARIDYTWKALKVAIGQTHGNTNASSNATDRKLTAMGASYDFGVASVGYSRVIADASSTQQHTFNLLSARVPVTKTLAIHGVYQNAKANTADEEASGFTFAVSQALSKRSTVYAQYSALDNKGANAGYGMRGTGSVVSSGDTVDPKAFSIGFMHTF